MLGGWELYIAGQLIVARMSGGGRRAPADLVCASPLLSSALRASLVPTVPVSVSECGASVAMVFDHEVEDVTCRLVSVRLLEASSPPSDNRHGSQTTGSSTPRRERERQKASRRRGAMWRATSVPRDPKVRACSWLFWNLEYVWM